MKPFFITTAIDYTNGSPHIGHAYEKVLTDVIARYHRLKGEDVFYLTGVDQHGQKVQQSAEKAGVAPQEFVDGITAKFRALWEKLGVQYDGWAATTDALHKECVRANLQMLWDDKDLATGQSRWIYKKSEGGHYSVRQEQFLTDKERGEDGEFGPEWQPVEFREEENFYFRLTQDLATGLPGFDPKQWLLDFIDKRSADGEPFVVPDFRVAELRNAVEKLEGDLCISRPAARLQWGIPFPESFGAGFVTYVWFDALVNYISFVPGHDPGFGHRTADAAVEKAPGTLGFVDWWPAVHVIGKDIMIPAHGVYWPVMLKALGFTDDEMPTLLVHGWWNIAGAKMSKSLGNVIDPDALANKYGAEAVRYYLVADIVTGKDSDFSEERLIQRYNVDLANSLGNLLNRTLSMAHRYRGGELMPSNYLSVEHSQFAELHMNCWTQCCSAMEEFRADLAIEHLMRLVRGANEFIESEAPWKLAKDPNAQSRLDAVLGHLVRAIRTTVTLLIPIVPEKAYAALDQLKMAPVSIGPIGNHTSFENVRVPDGHQLGSPVPLFPRIEAPAA